jgi:hypothetical protein
MQQIAPKLSEADTMTITTKGALSNYEIPGFFTK